VPVRARPPLPSLAPLSVKLGSPVCAAR